MMRPTKAFVTWLLAVPLLLFSCRPEAPATLSPTETGQGEFEGLTFDEFIEAGYQRLLERDPELMLSTGLYKIYGSPPPVLTDNSEAFQAETAAIYTVLGEVLRRYDRAALGPEERVSYDSFEWLLEDRLRGREFRHYEYPVVHFIIGQQYELIQFFEELHPLETREDAEAYVQRLGLVDEKVDNILEALRLGKEAGVVAPRFIFEWEMDHVRSLAEASPENTPFYARLWEGSLAIEGVGESERKELLDAASQAIEASVLPAFDGLATAMSEMMEIAPTTDGVWQFPKGEQYYDYLLHHHTTTDLTADEVHELGLQELQGIQAEMREQFDELGYPKEESLPVLFERVANDGGWVRGGAALGAYEDLISAAEERLDEAFDLRPEAELKIASGPPTVAYYVPGSMDGTRPGVFYASSGSTPAFAMPTLAYHEAVPGHHFQIALAQQLELPTFRRVETFTAYDEGWALYAERLAKDLGWYEGDPYGELGRLQAEAFRAARLVVDTGIHARQWTFDEALDFMIQNTGKDQRTLNYEVSRYIAWPGQATAYEIGMLKILELRQRAMEELGDDFDLKEFHRAVLQAGSVPLPVLEQVVTDYLESHAGP
jgi:uncharacterized protein (DUF885 family)